MRGAGPGIVAAVMLGFYLGFSFIVPVWDDELYYWCWGQDWQLSYFDHPPLVAYAISLSTMLFGDSLPAIRLPACLAMAGVVWSIARTVPLGWLLALILATPVMSLGAVLATPDAFLLLAWSAYLLWLRQVHETNPPSLRSWILGGVILGLGIMSKYPMALAIPASFLSFALVLPVRVFLVGFGLHLIIAGALALPILLFNLQHDFQPLLFQLRHAAGDGLGDGRSLGEFIGIQALLVGTLPIVLLPWVIVRWPQLRTDPLLRVSACAYGVPMIFFLTKAAHGPLEGNWALASYLGFWPLLPKWFAEVRAKPLWRWASLAGFLPPLLATIVLGIHLVCPWEWIPPNSDRISRQPARLELGRQIRNDLPDPTLPVYTPYYQWVSLLRFCGVNAHQEPGITRASNYTLTGKPMKELDQFYYFSEYPLPEGHAPGFLPPRKVSSWSLKVRGSFYATYELWLYTR